MSISKFISSSLLALTATIGAACAANSADMKTIQANNYLKPGASVSYTHNLKSQISAGETTTFSLSLAESYNQGKLRVSLASDGDISLFSTSTQAEFDMSLGTSHSMNISLLAHSNGRHYINVYASAIGVDGLAQPRIFSIPVQVGPSVAQKPNENMKTMPDGENIIEMEAQEEIK